jgi:acyl-CoA synthetase (AMP-forming)/AMP-acid ligase II
VATADGNKGEVPVAYIVPRGDSIDSAGLERRRRDKLASFKIPRAFVPVKALPRNALGKVQKHLLP